MALRHRRNRTPYKNARLVPGVFVSPQDQIVRSATRELMIFQLITFLVTNLGGVLKTRRMNLASLSWRPCLVIDHESEITSPLCCVQSCVTKHHNSECAVIGQRLDQTPRLQFAGVLHSPYDNAPLTALDFDALGAPGGMPVLTQHFARRTLLQL